MEIFQGILNNPRYSAQDRQIIDRAFSIANEAHDGQKRRSGEPYIIHPVHVAKFLADMGLDAATIAACILHDTLEDTGITRSQIEKEFGREIAFLVDGVTKLDTIPYSARPGLKKSGDPHVESLKKMFFAMAEDLRVILIKLADRYHNMKTLKALSAEAQTRIAMETLEIYAPIAGRLGMGHLKGELEDLAFPYAYPEDYRWLVSSMKTKYADHLKYIERTKPLIKRYLADAGIAVTDIHSRVKHYYSLFRKLDKYSMDVDKVFDLVAMRIIVPDIRSCYETLGILHNHYKPLAGRIKDFIAVPKPNGYQSLHTTIFCEKGRVVEVQIRTADMHEHAENGIAAHWSYSESGKRTDTRARFQTLAWVNKLKNSLKDIKSKEGLADLKIDFFKNRIFVFTPLGDIKDLPEGATPIDFAYAIHSGIGETVGGAKVNDRMVSLDHELCNGDVVEIIKNKNAHPSRDWLSFVKTNEAKKHIRTWLRTFDPANAPKEESKPVTPHQPILKPQATKPKIKKEGSQVAIQGERNMLYKLGKCCSPAAPQKIRGYVTLNRGVTVHRSDCSNLKNAERKRLLSATWS